MSPELAVFLIVGLILRFIVAMLLMVPTFIGIAGYILLAYPVKPLRRSAIKLSRWFMQWCDSITKWMVG